MDFVLQWLWYLLAFVAGSGVGGLVGAVLNRIAGREKPAVGQ